jgi:thioredoxin 1
LESEKPVHSDEEHFESDVLKSNLPVVVDFYADWCGPCKMIAPIMEELSKEYDGKVKFVKVNTDDNQELAVRYEVMSIPYVVFFKSGAMQDAVIGAAPSSTYKRKIEQVLLS